MELQAAMYFGEIRDIRNSLFSILGSVFLAFLRAVMLVFPVAIILPLREMATSPSCFLLRAAEIFID